MIEAYSFGKMTLDGKVYSSDLIIYPERIDHSWWRRSGHSLCVKDIQQALDAKPEVLIIGTGYMGLMKVTDEVKETVDNNRIELIIQKSQKAVKSYNEMAVKKKTIGAFHLTC